jgi:H+-transporting ATPase
LRCSREGLTSEAAEQRLTIFGHNKLEEKRVIFFFEFFVYFFCSDDYDKAHMKKIEF